MSPDPDKGLDFLVIGAPKSATTSLHAALKDHPQVSLPATKEAPYFTDQPVYEQGMEHYLAQHFDQAPSTNRWGTITPHYMLGQGSVTVATAAERIRQALPDISVIALLRHPVERAFSHYKMLYLRGYLTLPFDEQVDADLAQIAADPEPSESGERTTGYLRTSSYGQVLQHYYDRYPAERILVLTTDEYQADPLASLRAVCEFIGVDTDYRPPDAGSRHREGGMNPKIKWLTAGRLYRIPGVKRFWKNVVPAKLRNTVEYRTNLWNIRQDDVKLDRESPTYRRLVDHYAGDVAHLEKLTGRRMPWSDWHGQ